jgi:hypothetical protein
LSCPLSISQTREARLTSGLRLFYLSYAATPLQAQHGHSYLRRLGAESAKIV